MNITILPGSFKPPHKGHLSLIKKIINKNNNSKIIIIISKKSRTLDNRFQYFENLSKEELQIALIEYFPLKKKEIEKYSKNELLKIIKEYIEKNKIKSINAYQSIKIWKIYLKYLKEYYSKNKKKINFPKIILKISDTNNIIQETVRIMLQSLREKPNKIILMKSLKNKNNQRFNFMKKRFGKYIEEVLFPNIKDIDAREMRNAIKIHNYKKFNKYLPNNLKENDKKKIWKIVNIYNL
jgi:cytidyltransferase-like protein